MTPILCDLNPLFSDKNELFAAKQFLEHAASTNLPEFLKALSDVLVNTSYGSVARTAAGLQLKNHLISKDPLVLAQYQQRWLSFPEGIREYIKKNVSVYHIFKLSFAIEAHTHTNFRKEQIKIIPTFRFQITDALGTEASRPSSAAQCVACVAVIELPEHQWQTLITTLVSKVVIDGTSERGREAALEAIGYICQDISSDVLENQSNQILTAIIYGMRKEEPSNHVRLAATTALLNSLEFTKANFDKQTERNYIMEVVCESTQSPDTQISVAALQCLVKILSLYYQYMEPYMAQALFPITLEAMKSENDQISLQGIEFWSNVSEEELDLAIENQEAHEIGRPPNRVSKHYARGALQFLVPVLIEKLTKQEEFDDEDDWNPSKAASVCLMLLASCCEDDIVPFVLPFVTENIKSTNWRFRDAALMSLGSILGGLDTVTLKPLVENAIPTLIQLMYDSSVIVRDTTAWVFGRICEIIPSAAIKEEYLKPLLESLLQGLKAEPRVAANVCWAFTGLVEAAYTDADTYTGSTVQTNCLSPYFEFIVNQLLETTDRSDGAQANLRGAAYEALMDMIKNAPADCYTVVQKTTMVILERLNQVLQMESQVAQCDRFQFNDLQSLLCATLQSVLRKVDPEDAPKISDTIMTALLTMFSNSSGKSGGVQEDALMAVSTLVDLLGEKFLKYMDAFKQFLYMGLKNHHEHQVCCAAVGLTGDICRVLKGKILPYCDDIMTLLLENLSLPNLHRSIKPQILSVFGDMALGIGSDFKKYLLIVMQMLSHASQLQVDPNDYDMVEYLNELRESVLEAYTGIIQGFKGADQVPNPEVKLLEPHVSSIIQFVVTIAQDPEISDSIIAIIAGLIGDLCSAFGAPLLTLVDNEHIGKLLQDGRKSKTQRTKQLSGWASKEIKKLREREPIQIAASSW